MVIFQNTSSYHSCLCIVHISICFMYTPFDLSYLDNTVVEKYDVMFELLCVTRPIVKLIMGVKVNMLS